MKTVQTTITFSVGSVIQKIVVTWATDNIKVAVLNTEHLLAQMGMYGQQLNISCKKVSTPQNTK